MTDFSSAETSNLIFIDTNIDDYQSLIPNTSNSEVILLDSGTNGIEQISSALERYDELDSISIFSHGDAGLVQLGDTYLSDENLSGYSNDLTSWGEALAEHGDLLFYGCNIGADGEGLDFINEVAALTGADVAASNDLTGNFNLGGDWTLEVATGKIETPTFVANGYDGVLDLVLNRDIADNFEFNGTNTKIEIPDSDALDITSNLTLSARINADSFRNYDGIIVKGVTNAPYGLQVWSDGSLRFKAKDVNDDGSSATGSWLSNTKLNTNEWNDVAVTYDGSHIRFYINGELDSNVVRTDLTFATNDQPLVIGADLPGNDQYFDGQIDDVKVYNRALSASEIVGSPEPAVTTSNNNNSSNLPSAPSNNNGSAGLVLNPDIADNFEFNGTSTKIEIPDSDALDITSELTLSARINADSFRNWDGIIAKGVEDSPYALQVWSDGSLFFQANRGNLNGAVGGGYGGWRSNTKLDTNEWNDVAVTYDGTDIRFYINGQLDSNVVRTDLTFGTNNEPLVIGADLPGGDQYFDGQIDDVKVHNRALSASEIAGNPNPPVTTNNNESAGLVLNRDIADNFEFDGTSTKIEIPDSDALDITSELTLSARINADSFRNYDGIIVKGVNNAPYGLQVWEDGSLRFKANNVNDNGGVGSGAWRSNTKLDTNEWNDVAVTYDGSYIRFYINGQLDSNVVRADLIFGTNNEPLVIGADLPRGDQYFDGQIDDVKVYNRALSTNEIAGNPNPPVTTNNNNINSNISSAPSNNNGSAGLVFSSDIRDSFEFNGTSTKIEIADNNALDITSDLTLSARINADSFRDHDGIITKGINGTPYSLRVMADGSLGFLANWRVDGGSGSGLWFSNTKMNTNEWNDVAVTYDGTDLRFYINGQLDSNVVRTDLTFGTNNEPLVIGADLPGADEYFDGQIGNVKVYNRALSANEIANNSNALTTTTNNSSPPLTSTSNTSGSLGFNITYDLPVASNTRVAFEAAAEIWKNLLGDDVTVNIHVTQALNNELPDNVLAGAVPSFIQDTSYSTVRNQLAQDRTSAEDNIAYSNLESGSTWQTNFAGGNQDVSEVALTRANAKALNIIDPHNNQLDGIITVNSLDGTGLAWENILYQDVTNTEFDLVSVAVHEIGHILGFVSSVDALTVDTANNVQLIEDAATSFDLFRYSSNGQRQIAQGGASYFSIDGGQSSYGDLSQGAITELSGDGYQGSHWRNTDNNGIMDPVAELGQRRKVSDLDLRAFDAIGWDRINSTESLTALYNKASARNSGISNINRNADVSAMLQDFRWARGARSRARLRQSGNITLFLAQEGFFNTGAFRNSFDFSSVESPLLPTPEITPRISIKDILGTEQTQPSIDGSDDESLNYDSLLPKGELVSIIDEWLADYELDEVSLVGPKNELEQLELVESLESNLEQAV